MVTLTKDIKGIVITDNDEPIVHIYDYKCEDSGQRKNTSRSSKGKRRPDNIGNSKGQEKPFDKLGEECTEREQGTGLEADIFRQLSGQIEWSDEITKAEKVRVKPKLNSKGKAEGKRSRKICKTEKNGKGSWLQNKNCN